MEESLVSTFSEDRSIRMSQVRRLVVKIGSSSLTTPSNKLNRRAVHKLVGDVVALRRQGIEVAIVTSGAVAAGMGRLGLEARPRAISDLQAVAAVGQNLLMHTYESLFKRHGVRIGQVLLTAEDILYERRRYLNLENTFRSLFAHDAVPIINENDSVAVAELRRTIGENDMLAAYVSNLIQAQLLVILSNVDGLYTNYSGGGSKRELVRQVSHADTGLDELIGKPGKRAGSGGMETKLQAAKLLMACGEMVVIAHARKHHLADILAGEELGTLFIPSNKRLRSRARWIAFASSCRGSVVVDKGAEWAITRKEKSLLPAGIVSCEGAFAAGDMIRVENEKGEELARGLSRYASDEVRLVFGKSSPEIEEVLGRRAPEVIHRDDLVII